MLRNTTLAVLAVGLAATLSLSARADDRLLETTPYGWYYSRTVRVDSRIQSISREGDTMVLRLESGEWTRIVAHSRVDVRIGDRDNLTALDLRQGDVVRVIGRPGANGTMFARRIDVVGVDRDRTRTPRQRRSSQR